MVDVNSIMMYTVDRLMTNCSCDMPVYKEHLISMHII